MEKGKVVKMDIKEKDIKEPKGEVVVEETQKPEETKSNEQRGLDYEQMVNVANQLHQENTRLRSALEEAHVRYNLTRLGFLMEVTQAKEGVFRKAFIMQAAEEIEKTLYPRDKEQPKNDSK